MIARRIVPLIMFVMACSKSPSKISKTTLLTCHTQAGKLRLLQAAPGACRIDTDLEPQVSRCVPWQGSLLCDRLFREVSEVGSSRDRLGVPISDCGFAPCQ